MVSVYLTGERLDELGAQPGQFFRWRFLAPGHVVDRQPLLPVRAAPARATCGSP